MENFGKKLNETRLKKGLTLEELSALSGISTAQLEEFEANTIPRPRRRTLKLLTATLGLDTNEALQSFGYFTANCRFKTFLKFILSKKWFS